MFCSVSVGRGNIAFHQAAYRSTALATKTAQRFSRSLLSAAIFCSGVRCVVSETSCSSISSSSGATWPTTKSDASARVSQMFHNLNEPSEPRDIKEFAGDLPVSVTNIFLQVLERSQEFQVSEAPFGIGVSW
jgi:hypothetical protein